jgi:hypothetical protein
LTSSKTNLANLVFPESLPVPGRFEFTKNFRVRDLVNGSTLAFSGSPDPSMSYLQFEFDGCAIEGSLHVQPKYPEKPTVRGSPDNPILMISAYAWSISFGALNMADREFNSALVLYTTHMIAFRNAVSFPYRIFLWSDYSRRQPKVLAAFDMPSDDNLVAISAAWQDM